MSADRLLLFAAGFPEDALTPFVPPGEWVERHAFPGWRRPSAGTLVADLDVALAAGHGRQWVIPCFSSAAASPYAYRFMARAERADGSRTPWRCLGAIGAFADADLPAGAETDVGDDFNATVGAFFVKRAIRRLRLRLLVSATDASDVDGAPSLISVALSPNARQPRRGSGRSLPPVEIALPARSQMRGPAPLRGRICAPTSVSMVMDYFGVGVATEAVAARAYHAATDRYGVWQQNIRAASGWGFLGYVGRFPSVDAARALIGQGTPVIASIRYQAGGLDGAPLESTTGHLVAVRGFGDGVVSVNDPAGGGGAAVRRAYRAEQFAAAWMASGGVGLVLFPAPSRPPPVGRGGSRSGLLHGGHRVP